MSSTQYVDINRTLKTLEDRVSPANYQDIREFINHQAAEGISEVQQQRQIYSLRLLITDFTPDGFRLKEATETELKDAIAAVHRSDYADATQHKIKGTVKKFYKIANGGHEHPEKVDFFSTTQKKATSVTRDQLFTDDELKKLFHAFSNTRDRAFTMILYESAARPGELLECSIADFTANEKGDFIFLQGKKNTPDRTNQLIRAGRTVREWLAQHPKGGELGDIADTSAHSG
jgi:site-specific recombinase XerD